MKRTFLALLIGACCAPAFATSPLVSVEPVRRPRLKTIYSTVKTLDQFVDQRSRGLVLVFLGTECPVARQYLPRLKELHREYELQGVRFLGIYSNVGVNAFTMATHVHDEDIPFPVLQDVDHKLADLLAVETTPEVVVLDAKLDVRYQGAIDDQFARGGRRPQATAQYLAAALAALVKGESIEPAYVPPSGCPIERNEPKRAQRDVTYYKDVAPIVQKNCQVCHRPTGPGPFELLTYDDVAYNAEKIREVVIDRRMPPWHGVLNPKYGTLLNDKRLSQDDIDTLIAWVDGGATEGNKSDGPPAVRWPAPGDWTVGTPDFVYRIKPFVVPKSGILDYQFFRVRMGLDHDRWFRAVEVKPGNPEVVHHIALHVLPSQNDQSFDGVAAMALLYGLNAERGRLINDYVPGDTYNAKKYPADQAVLIPKQHDLIFEVHYTPNGKAATTDQSMVGFQWAQQPPQHEVMTTVFRVPIGGFRIPPHHPHFRFEDEYYFQHDIEIDAIRPHFHLRGKSFRLERISRDSNTDEIIERETILTVPLFDQAWQRTYELAKPLFLPAGTELLATAHFDNSSLNPNNPDPSAEVLWSQQTDTGEMFSTRFKYRLAQPQGQ
jgi:mono/diheme cytochrome c family protein